MLSESERLLVKKSYQRPEEKEKGQQVNLSARQSDDKSNKKQGRC